MSLSTFELAKQRQNYQPPALRAGCQNCTHVSQLKTHQCMKGGFYTWPLSICDLHEVKADRPVQGAAA